MMITKTKQRKATTATSQPKARTEKQMAADREKAARRLAREIEQKESDDRFTSPQLIRAIEYSFGKIDFDPCWHPASAVRPKAYLDVRQGHNGLRNAWFGPLAFVNPPWSSQDKWLKRAYDQWLKGNVATVVCLVPAKTDARFFHDVLSKDADVYFLEGRPRFSKVDGSSEATMVSTMVVMFGASREQKRRFAELVRGSWWLPTPAPSFRSEQAGTAVRGLVHHHGPVSCAAPDHRLHRTAICGPSSALAIGSDSIGAG